MSVSAKIPLTLGAGHQKPTSNFLWVVLWVEGVMKTHILLIKFGKTKQSHFVQLHQFQPCDWLHILDAI